MRRLMCAVAIVLCHALSVAAQEPTKGWLDVNFGIAEAAEKDRTSTRVLTISQEAGGASVAYGLSRGASFDFGGGYMFTPRVGLGVTFGGTAHSDIAGLAISIPHPIFFNRSATDADVTNRKLDRVEGAVHITGMAVLASGRKFSIRVFGGPTFFRVQQDTVTRINYNQVFNLLGGNAVDITTFEFQESEATGWGGHVGADVSVFFTHVVGVGGLVRFSRGKVDLDDYGGVENIKAGGVQAGGGLRLRF